MFSSIPDDVEVRRISAMKSNSSLVNADLRKNTGTSAADIGGPGELSHVLQHQHCTHQEVPSAHILVTSKTGLRGPQINIFICLSCRWLYLIQERQGAHENMASSQVNGIIQAHSG